MAPIGHGWRSPRLALAVTWGVPIHATRLVLLAVTIVTAVGPAAPFASAAAPPALASPIAGSTRTGPSGGAVVNSIVTPFAPGLQETIAPGVQRQEGTLTTSGGPQAVELFDIDPADAAIGFETSVASGGVSYLETMSGQAARASRDGHRVVAAVNGDIWTTDSRGKHAPAGLLVHRGELYTGSSGLRPTFGLDGAEAPRIGDVSVATRVTLADGITILGINRVNKPRRAGDLVLFTRRHGATTATTNAGVEVVLKVGGLPIRPSGTWTATVAAVRVGIGDAPIATGTVVLSTLDADVGVLSALPIGSTVIIATTITTGWETIVEAVSGREWVLRDGATMIRPLSPSTGEAHPRSAVGIAVDGHVLLAAVDGRQPGYSIGLSLPDLADVLHARGAVDAINLDGGGSTTALVRRPGDVEVSLVNRPSDGHQRAVANGLLVVSSIPTGPLATVLIRPTDPTAVVGSTVSFATKGQDAALNGVPVAPTSVTWSLDGNVGTLSSAGRFVASTPGDASVSAKVASVTGSTALTVVPDTMAPVSSAPIARTRLGATVSATSVPFTVSWAAATDVGTGVAGYELRRQLDGGGWTPVALATSSSRSVAQDLPPGHAARYQVRATDRAGNVGAWRSATGFQVRLVSEGSSAVRYSTGWKTRFATSFLGGATRSAGIAGRTATFTFTGSQVAWIAPRSLYRGSARVTVDGVLVGSVSLYRSTTQPRRIVFSRAWSVAARHTVSIRVSGTPGHPWVDVDGFVVVGAPPSDPVLVGAGDIASCGLTGDTATAKVLDGIAGTVFTAGDNAYENGTAAQFANCYAPTWGRHRSRTRPVPGNHDYGTGGAAPYFAYFGSRAGTAGQGWYAYDIGAWRVYALNSNCASIGGCGAGSVQETWLRADLAANPRACVAAIWHHPLFSSGVHGNDPMTRDLWKALDEAGADVVINGHDHDYERFALQDAAGAADGGGMREFVVGTGGAGLRAFGTIRANSQIRKTGVLGVLKLTLRATGYNWRFVAAAGSAWTDTGSAACQ